MRAHILLKAGSNRPGWPDERIVNAFGCPEQTAYNVRKRFTTRGRLASLERNPQSGPSRMRKLEDQNEALLIALACSNPSERFARWTLHLLADRLVELQIVESISIETIRQPLKKRLASASVVLLGDPAG